MTASVGLPRTHEPNRFRDPCFDQHILSTGIWPDPWHRDIGLYRMSFDQRRVRVRLFVAQGKHQDDIAAEVRDPCREVRTRGWLPDEPAESLRAQFVSQLLFGAPGLPVDQRHDRSSEPLFLAWREQSQD